MLANSVRDLVKQRRQDQAQCGVVSGLMQHVCLFFVGCLFICMFAGFPFFFGKGAKEDHEKIEPLWLLLDTTGSFWESETSKRERPA